MGRFADAYRTLRGKTDHQVRASAQMARIEAQWHLICNEIADILEQMNRVDARLRKREERAKKPKQPAEPPAPQTPSEAPAPVARSDAKAYKAALRARYFGSHNNLLVPTPTNGDLEVEEAP